jgi:hypothetical protein
MLTNPFRMAYRSVLEQQGSLLLEVLITMLMIGVAVGALMSVYTSGVISLRNSSLQGNARILVDARMEKLKALPWSELNLSGLPSQTSDVYYMNPPTNVSSAEAATQTVGGAQAATQTVHGSDGRSYRVDTYILRVGPFPDPAPYASIIQLFVAARPISNGVVGGIAAQASSSAGPLSG